MRNVIERIANGIDRLILFIGNVVAWTSPALMCLICYMVFMRYVFSWTSIPLEDLQWHIYAVGLLIAMSYAEVLDKHIRIDIYYVNMRTRTKAWLNIMVMLLLVMPFALTMLDYGIEFTYKSYEVGEQSRAGTGLTHRWIIKSLMPIGFVLLSLSALSSILKNVLVLIRLKQR